MYTDCKFVIFKYVYIAYICILTIGELLPRLLGIKEKRRRSKDVPVFYWLASHLLTSLSFDNICGAVFNWSVNNYDLFFMITGVIIWDMWVLIHIIKLMHQTVMVPNFMDNSKKIWILSDLCILDLIICIEYSGHKTTKHLLLASLVCL